ncbi:MAG: DUF2130 domain-containing protein [Thaumarchaeota archaeon]|nr:DUF2130 domain-containing protein [Nitrososphaerota archaeon]
MKFLIELKSTDDSKLRKTVDEFIAAQTDLQGRQRSEFLARLDAVLAIDIERMKDYREIVRTVSEIKERLMGTGIGQANEILTILNLKKICPWDRFDEAKSKAEGMDIIAWVFDKGSECGRISISVEYDLKWHELFIQQLSKNMEDDACRWGLLVSKSFPQEALNPRFFVTTNVLGRNILLIKPELAPLAYLAARHVAIYWKGIATAEVRGQERLQKSRVREAIDQWLYEPEFATDLSSISDAQKEVEEMGSTTRAIREYLLERVRRIDDYCSKILAHLARCRTRLDGLQNRLDESKQLTGIAIKVCPK